MKTVTYISLPVAPLTAYSTVGRGKWFPPGLLVSRKKIAPAERRIPAGALRRGCVEKASFPAYSDYSNMAGTPKVPGSPKNRAPGGVHPGLFNRYPVLSTRPTALQQVRQSQARGSESQSLECRGYPQISPSLPSGKSPTLGEGS